MQLLSSLKLTVVSLSLASLAPLTAQAEIALPDCETMAAWASEADLRDRQQLNPSTTLGFPTAFLGQEMIDLYGKPGPDFSPDDVAMARQAAKDCGRQVSAKDLKKVLAGLEKEFARGLGPTLEKMAKARVDLDTALEAFAAAPEGVDKLSTIIGLRAMADWDSNAYTAAVRYLDRDFRKVADQILRAMASLPQEIVAQAVLPSVDPHYDASRDAVLAEVRQQLDALEASEQSLRTFDRDAAKILQPPRRQPLAAILPPDDRAALEADVAARKSAIEQALIAAAEEKFAAMPATAASFRQIENAAGSGLVAVLSPEAKETYKSSLRVRRQSAALAIVDAIPSDMQGLASLPELRKGLHTSPAGLPSEEDLAAIDQAIAAKQAVAGKEIARDLLDRIAQTPVESRAFKALDGYSDQRVLRLLAPEDADAIQQAADSRRAEVGGDLYPKLAAELAGLSDTEKSLAMIDTVLLPDIDAWPASAGDHRTRFLQAVVDKRNAILAALTLAEKGPLRGRVYADRSGMTKLEFGDGGRAYVTEGGGQTLVAPYEEEDETRVLVTLPQGTVVFTREGRWLVGGPLQLQRVDTAQ